MQTFLPYSDFRKSAKVLDDKRLNKQIVEAWQIMVTLQEGSKWENHPAVLMWVNHEYQLNQYLEAMYQEWVMRGHTHSCRPLVMPVKNASLPPWIGHPAFHLSHIARLLEKDYRFYSQHWPDNDDLEDLPYLWPVHKGNKVYEPGVFYVLGQGKPDAWRWGDLAEEYRIKIIVPK